MRNGLKVAATAPSGPDLGVGNPSRHSLQTAAPEHAAGPSLGKSDEARENSSVLQLTADRIFPQTVKVQKRSKMQILLWKVQAPHRLHGVAGLFWWPQYQQTCITIRRPWITSHGTAPTGGQSKLRKLRQEFHEQIRPARQPRSTNRHKLNHEVCKAFNSYFLEKGMVTICNLALYTADAVWNKVFVVTA